MIYACKRCGGFKRAPNVICSNPCSRTKEDVELSPHQQKVQPLRAAARAEANTTRIDENNLFPNRPELQNPYGGVYERLSLIREEKREMEAKKREYDNWENLRKPILDKEQSLLLTFLQAMGEVIDEQRDIKQKNPELFIPKAKVTREPKPEVPKEKSHKPQQRVHRAANYTPMSYGDDVVLAVSEYLNAYGDTSSGVLYEKLAHRKVVEPIKGARPALSFAHRLHAAKQEDFYFDASARMWSLTRPATQTQIKSVREEKKTTGVVIPSNATAPTNGNGHLYTAPKPRPSKEDHARGMFVLAVNSVFKMQDNQPMGLVQIWDVVEHELPDHVMQLVGAQNLEGFKTMMRQCADDFAAMEGGLYYPVHPDMSQTVITKAGKVATV